MTRNFYILVAAIAALFFSAQAHAEDTQPYYLIATIDVTDFDSYMEQYGSIAIPEILAVGGEILIGSRSVDLLEGEYSANWTVVVKFPSQAAGMAWYEAANYQAVIPVRHALSNQENSVLLLAPQFVMPSE